MSINKLPVSLRNNLKIQPPPPFGCKKKLQNDAELFCFLNLEASGNKYKL